MRYLPLNNNDRAQMLDVIGVDNIDAVSYTHLTLPTIYSV